MAIEAQKVPKLRVQRMGKLWRIVYDDTRTLAKYGDGSAVDEGGFEDVWKDGRQVEDGRLLALQQMSRAIDGQPTTDPEEENIEPAS